MLGIDPKALYAGMKKETVPCGLCGSEDLVDAVDIDRYGMGAKSVMCKRCGFVFTNPRPIQEEMNRFYCDHYRDFYFGFPDPRKDNYLDSSYRKTAVGRAQWLFDFSKAELERRTDEAPTILDVGCGEGAFLQIARSNIPDSTLFGCEPTPEYASFAEECSGANVFVEGVDVFASGHPELAGRFNLIVVSHVLEHLYDPAKKLLKLKELLAPDGLLCVEVPDLLSPYWSGVGIFHIGHVNQFTEDTLRFAFARTGLLPIRSFNGKHPVDEWAMTFLCRKADDIVDLRKPLLKSEEEANRLLRRIQRQADGAGHVPDPEPEARRSLWRRMLSSIGHRLGLSEKRQS